MSALTNPAERQILVNIGNRYVVFGPEPSLPQQPAFDPDRDAAVLPRVADESEVAAERIAQTLKVANLEGHALTSEEADVVLSDQQGHQILVELKVRENDPKMRDLAAGYERIQKEMRLEQKTLEVWHFNLERLKLYIQTHQGGTPGGVELPAVDVWEKTAEGVFRRQQVIDEVAQWERQLRELYQEVEGWVAQRPDLVNDFSRSVTMSEEMMQKFAVPDRELPVMDILLDGRVVASFIPRGRWMIGSWGRIDIITPQQTHVLVLLRDSEGEFAWRYAEMNDRRQLRPFDKETLLTLLRGA
ncbi:hypothetical protein KTE26_11360 [Ralstonia mannitolilytica]|uniref:hypothetical protein n=1 Tax=Ralstonia mannitolilytica TaxID=105219 RepID=UPI0013156FD7|nr:hypothetical protein [Ralstonia mannitolilytica]MBU9579032.1 hypothetical protein [Ralstonia mannitolilytica]